jgi:ribosome-binding protein aMBF1 (putative translation factor)
MVVTSDKILRRRSISGCVAIACIAMDFAKKIELARMASGMARDDLAAAIGASVSSIGSYEQGKARPTAEKAVIIARLLGVPLDWLLDDTRTESASLAREMAGYVRDLGYQGIRARIIGDGLRKMGDPS